MHNLPEITSLPIWGDPRFNTAFIGELEVQELIRGSQFIVGKNDDGEVLSSTDPDFQKFVDNLKYGKDNAMDMQSFPYKDCFLFFVQPNKQYYTVHDYILVDVLFRNKYCIYASKDLSYKLPTVDSIASLLRVRVIKLIHHGRLLGGTENVLLEKRSDYRDDNLLGIVVKNHNQLTYAHRAYNPVYVKHEHLSASQRPLAVSHSQRLGRTPSELFVDAFRDEERWKVLVSELSEILTGNLEADLPVLSKAVQNAVLKNEESYKNGLWATFKQDCLNSSINGLRTWYHQKLIERKI